MSAGEKNDCDERLRSEQTDFSLAKGDFYRLSFCREDAEAPFKLSIALSAPLRLCASAFSSLGWRVGGLCSLCELCASVVIPSLRRRNRCHQGLEIVAFSERIEIGVGLQQFIPVEAMLERFRQCFYCG